MQQPNTFVPATDDKLFPDTKLSSKESLNKYSSLLTRMCDDRFVDDLCSLVGNMASNWGYFESEIIFILTKRLEIYFNAFEISHSLGEFLDCDCEIVIKNASEQTLKLCCAFNRLPMAHANGTTTIRVRRLRFSRIDRLFSENRSTYRSRISSMSPERK